MTPGPIDGTPGIPGSDKKYELQNVQQQQQLDVQSEAGPSKMFVVFLQGTAGTPADDQRVKVLLGNLWIVTLGPPTCVSTVIGRTSLYTTFCCLFDRRRISWEVAKGLTGRKKCFSWHSLQCDASQKKAVGVSNKTQCN